MPHDWWALIDKRAAVKENSPPLRRVARERPGCADDRAAREHWAADNRARTARSLLPEDVAAYQLADADRFISKMKAKQQAEFLSRIGRKTA